MFCWNRRHNEVLERLSTIEGLILALGELLMASLDALAAQVKENTDVEASAIVLINGIAAALAAAATDPAAVLALAAQLKASADSLAAAVKANTPPPPPPPPPAPVV